MTLILVAVLIILLIIPSDYDAESFNNRFVCKRHNWGRKTDSDGNNPYLQCLKCGNLPGNDEENQV